MSRNIVYSILGDITLQNFIYYHNYLMTNGIVKFFNKTKNFGFIAPADEQRNVIEGEKEVFVHITWVNGNIADNDRVTFEIGEGQKGPEAKNVTKIDSDMDMAA